MKRTNQEASNREKTSPDERGGVQQVAGAAAWTTKRRKLQLGGAAKIEPKQRDSSPNNNKAVAAADAAEFPKLDQSNPEHARRIQQRRRMVAFGKNTVGYDEYKKQVPKEKRRPRCMTHPSTPDHTLDIPTKRWQGLIRAWRRALHQYDPPDMMKALDNETVDMEVDDDKLGKCSPGSNPSEKNVSSVAQTSEKAVSISNRSSPSSVATLMSSETTNQFAFVSQNDTEDLDVWERVGDGCFADDSDDDDLL